MIDDPIDSAMVEAVQRVGKVVGVRTIAEFVESDAILDRLRQLGVDFAQGYAVARPSPFEGEPGSVPNAAAPDARPRRPDRSQTA